MAVTAYNTAFPLRAGWGRPLVPVNWPLNVASQRAGTNRRLPGARTHPYRLSAVTPGGGTSGMPKCYKKSGERHVVRVKAGSCIFVYRAGFSESQLYH